MYQIKLWVLEWRMDRFNKKVDKAIEKVKKDHPKVDPGEVQAEFSNDFFFLHDKINVLKSTHFLNLAYKYIVPAPSETEKLYWTETSWRRTKILTEDGIYYLRKKIRDEIKERHSMFLPWATLLLSLIAALASLWNIFR